MSVIKVKRVAIVGLGSIGRRHLRLLKQLRPEIEMILVRSGKGGRWPEESLAKASVTSVDEALTMDVDAAIISSPAPFHVPQAIKLLSAGIPTLIEKPVSHNMDGVHALKGLAEKTQAPVLVGYVIRYSLGARYFYEMARGSRIGEPIAVNIICGSYLPDWRPEQDYRTTASARAELGGGALLELSHEIDYANWFFGPFQNIGAVLRNTGTLDIDVEDIAELTLRSQSKLPVSIHLDFCRRDAIRQCTLHGSEGTLTWDGIENTVGWKPEFGQTEQWSFNIERDAMFRMQLTHFLACIEQGEAPNVTLDDGIAALTLVEAAKQSHREGKIIDL
ncbi:oxidoreductase domain protein [Thiorhodococcus drewsii AZ1]|uniref:Oxidoreductase domain protein n=1 Tax=Thiorhodococcus drewsii AZ1 TaxID=765913 RepID=G2E7E3_9GAMM|nr:Gfo/Idh/MocA family oxidoreductase [Thiorhodococcus drewsii]EGV27982.1 oxidoreductase domain protein [Thiorhodococcus drewsii AZ1]